MLNAITSMVTTELSRLNVSSKPSHAQVTKATAEVAEIEAKLQTQEEKARGICSCTCFCLAGRPKHA